MPETRKPFFNTWVALTLCVVVAIALAALCVGNRFVRMQRAAAATEVPIEGLHPGDQAKLVLRLDTVFRGGADATVLKEESETRYRCTVVRVRTLFTDTTPVVMGGRDDLRSAAVVHITGVVDKDHQLVAGKIVVLTNYVQVTPCL